MKPKVLMVAYACNPEGHGEHWLGWGWAEQAAQAHEVHLITPTWYREPVARHAARLGIHVHFLDVAPQVARLTAPLNNAGLWMRQYPWQRAVAARAAQLHAEHRFAVVHQTTFHTFRVPFRAAWLGIPAVWGPVAGGESSPPGFGEYLGEARQAEIVRPILNRLCLWNPAVQRSLREVKRMIISTRNTLEFLPAWVRPKCTLLSPNAVREEELHPVVARAAQPGGELTLLYLGNCVSRRSVPLVLRAMARCRDVPVRLVVAGSGPALEGWRAETARLGLAARVNFAGEVPRARLPALYAATDALVFPSLRDSGGTSLLEAMSQGVPVVCLDWGGPGEVVRESTGVKVPVTSPETTLAGLAAAFRRLYAEPQWRAELGVAAAADVRARFTWKAKREVLERLYAEAQAEVV